MSKLWLILGFTSLGLALFGLGHQKIKSGIWWQWSDFLHHESLVGIAFSVGVALLVVAIIERYIRR